MDSCWLTLRHLLHWTFARGTLDTLLPKWRRPALCAFCFPCVSWCVGHKLAWIHWIFVKLDAIKIFFSSHQHSPFNIVTLHQFVNLSSCLCNALMRAQTKKTNIILTCVTHHSKAFKFVFEYYVGAGVGVQWSNVAQPVNVDDSFTMLLRVRHPRLHRSSIVIYLLTEISRKYYRHFSKTGRLRSASALLFPIYGESHT